MQIFASELGLDLVAVVPTRHRYYQSVAEAFGPNPHVSYLPGFEEVTIQVELSAPEGVETPEQRRNFTEKFREACITEDVFYFRRTSEDRGVVEMSAHLINFTTAYTDNETLDSMIRPRTQEIQERRRTERIQALPKTRSSPGVSRRRPLVQIYAARLSERKLIVGGKEDA